mmetsp:Transcript_7457/g.12864  ORF Transcript_7457/g.12864 Transcript_7457/m.12864 type:complete len:218 (-) Transcript_7457:804-1457(-)
MVRLQHRGGAPEQVPPQHLRIQVSSIPHAVPHDSMHGAELRSVLVRHGTTAGGEVKTAVPENLGARSSVLRVGCLRKYFSPLFAGVVQPSHRLHDPFFHRHLLRGYARSSRIGEHVYSAPPGGGGHHPGERVGATLQHVRLHSLCVRDSWAGLQVGASGYLAICRHREAELDKLAAVHGAHLRHRAHPRNHYSGEWRCKQGREPRVRELWVCAPPLA